MLGVVGTCALVPPNDLEWVEVLQGLQLLRRQNAVHIVVQLGLLDACLTTE